MSNNVNDVAGNTMQLVIPNTESLGKLTSMNTSFSLTTKYKTADEWAQLKDKPVRCYFMGVRDVPNDEGEAVTCGVFVSPTEVFLSGQTVLVDAIRNLEPKTPLEIIYRGKSQNKSSVGSTMKFDVSILK